MPSAPADHYITSSGNFRTQSLVEAILEIGAERDRRKIGRDNAVGLFELAP